MWETKLNDKNEIIVTLENGQSEIKDYAEVSYGDRETLQQQFRDQLKEGATLLAGDQKGTIIKIEGQLSFQLEVTVSFGEAKQRVSSDSLFQLAIVEKNLKIEKGVTNVQR